MFLKNELGSVNLFLQRVMLFYVCVQLIVILIFYQTLGSLDIHYILLITNMPYFCGRFSVIPQYWFARYFCERWIRDLELKIFTTWFAKMTLVQGAEQWLVLDLNFFTNSISHFYNLDWHLINHCQFSLHWFHHYVNVETTFC